MFRLDEAHHPRRESMSGAVPIARRSRFRMLASRRRLFSTAVTVGLSSVALTACAGGASQSAAVGVRANSNLYGNLPLTGGARSGGTITLGQLTGDTPTYIFPIIPAAQASTVNIYAFINAMFLPLYASPTGNSPVVDDSISVGEPPVYSDGDRTVTISLKHNYHWSSGAPVDARDVLFDIDLTKAAVHESAANLRRYSPGLYPDNVASAEVTGKYRLVLHLTRPYNPSFYTNNQLGIGDVAPLPSTAWNLAAAGGPHLDFTVPANATKIFDYLSKQGGKLSGFATNPLWRDVDGPFRLTRFSTVNGSYTMVRNDSYGGAPKPAYTRLAVTSYTGATPILNALKTGALDVAPIDFSQLGAVPSLKRAGFRIFGYPDFGLDDAILNFKDTTDSFDKVVAQRYVRQALAMLVDQPAMIKGLLKGAGAPGYGPVPAAPPSPYAPTDASRPVYPYSPAAAGKLLKAHGWKVVPNGTTTCVKPGTGAGECGAGIKAGTPIRFTWIYATLGPYVGLEAEVYSSAAARVGIHVTPVQKSFNLVVGTYNNVANPKGASQWGAVDFTGLTDSNYPTENSVFNTGGSFNFGSYDSSTANRLIKQTLYSSGTQAIKTESDFLTKDVPALYLPNADNIYAVSNRVGGPAKSWMAMTQYVYLPQYWYLRK
jgi:peptide/nickel transport system substrate-binding protein